MPRASPWYVPVVPNTMTAFRRCLVLILISILWFTVNFLVWFLSPKIPLADQLLLSLNCDVYCMYSSIEPVGLLLIWIFGMMYVVGYFQRWFG